MEYLKTVKKSSEINWPLPSSAQHQTAPKEKFHKLTNAEELGFDIGQKLMILIRKREFHPCTVIKLIDHFLTLKIDTLDGKEYICSAHDPIIFPLSWPQTQGLKFFIRLDLFHYIFVSKDSKSDMLVWVPPSIMNMAYFSQKRSMGSKIMKHGVTISIPMWKIVITYFGTKWC